MSEEVGFESSLLGTRDHWDDQYQTELINFRQSGEIGEVWFGEGSVNRVTRWLKQNARSDADVLDLGCGNGASLLSLHAAGFRKLTGVDYSESGIQLAKQIAEKENCEIIYHVIDLVGSLKESPLGQLTYDICLDKGTYDAIALCPEDADGKRAAYKRNVATLTKSGGRFIITSCNFTADELRKYFIGEYFEEEVLIPTPKIQFGGSEGSSTSVLVFKRI